MFRNMQYSEQIEKVISYIESNLKADIALADLARVCGYSQYHFLRVFKDTTGLTPADYIRKRRLSEISRQIDVKKASISGTAFEYGFNSKENFTRAFKKEHHVLPTQYKTAGNSLKLYGEFQRPLSEFELTPKIINLPGFSLTGFWSDEDITPNFWNKYNCENRSKRLSGGKICADYGAVIWNDAKNKTDYFIGILTEEASGDTTGASELYSSGGLYAVLSTPPSTHFDFVNTIHLTWEYIFGSWMPKSEYQPSFGHGMQFETYVEESRTYSEDIYIPVSKIE
ncbi:MAG: AraC family transcriptional regulator [Clostridiales bacterium]|jgi:AraC family transcriptional regulator|nr:AraC family transcriptional regulator [Clostridiales bacterium]